MHTLELKEFEGTLVAIFPDELLKELQIGEGDTLYLLKTAEGYVLTRDEPHFEKALRISRRGSEKYRSAPGELARDGAQVGEPDATSQ